MRYKRPYSLYKRNQNGRVIYYFRIYEGTERISKSTGFSSKEKARFYVESLIRDPEAFAQLFHSNFVSSFEPLKNHVEESKAHTKKAVIFNDYARDWWLWDKCKYVINKRAAGSETKPGIKKSHVDKSRMWMDNYIVPYFGHMEITSITTDLVNEFMIILSEKHKLSPKSINNIRSVFSVMMEEAKRLKLIEENPVKGTVSRRVDKKESRLLTDEECAKLFDPANIKTLWCGNFCFYTANYISGLTGMRIGELLALTIQDVSPTEIIIRKNYSSKYGIGTTKNSEVRRVPITKEMYLMLYTVYKSHKFPSDYIFCVTSAKPMGAANCRRSLYRALDGIGITEEERRKRNITFHSWRHKFTTDCIKANMHPEKIRALTGHKSSSMLTTYTDLSTNDMAEQVHQIQSNRMSATSKHDKKDKEDESQDK